MAISTIILLICIGKATRDSRIIAKKLRNMLSAAVFSMLTNIGLLLSTTPDTSNVIYAFFFISFDWLIYSLLAFTIEYTSNPYITASHTKVLRIILLIDTASFLLHLKFGHAYGIRCHTFADGTPYFHVITRPAYSIHMVLSYFQLIIVFWLLAHKIFTSPSLYKRKYYVVLAIFISIMLLNGLFVFTEQPYDISMILFAIGGTLIYYYALTYMPNDLIDNTLALVAKRSDDAMILFDVKGNCIYYNEKADDFLKIGQMSDAEKSAALLRWTGNQMLSMCGDFSHNCKEIIDGKEVHLRITFHRLIDKKSKYVGSFLTLRDRTDDTNTLQKEHFRATHDLLTGLYNKEYFFEAVGQHLKSHPNERFLMICSDIRNFKIINDVFGPEHGNELLIKISTALKELTHPGQIYGRLENDRFGILIAKKDYHEEIFLKGPREVASIEANYSYPIHIHVGVYEITNPTLPVSIMCDRALLALETIKDDYQKKIAYYNEELRNNVLSEQRLTGEAANAMNSGQIQIYLQPQVDRNGSIKGAEALARWIHPQWGIIPPREFIRAFEKNSMIMSLDQYIWELVCKELQKWKSIGREDLYISVNISPKDFFYMDVTKVLLDLVERYGISASNLRLEITETTLMSHLNRQLEQIQSLQDAGFIIEMDDFGDGISSLNVLKHIAVDALKIDMAFLKNDDSMHRAEKILRMIVELAKDLNLTVITEGVETPDQVSFLQNIGCELFQGFYFAKPMSVPEFEDTYCKQV